MEGTYEYELERAELLGVDPPSRESWEEQEKARKEVEAEQVQTAVAEELEADGEKIKGGHGKMDELNNILSATQLKINKFKTVCGSFTSLLKIRSGSPAPPESRGEANGQPSCSINNTLDDLDKLKEVNLESDMQFAARQTQDIAQKAGKNLDALDRLINKAETAQISLENQNQQMKSYLRK